MKGTIFKGDYNSWHVSFTNEHGEKDELPLHSDDVEFILEQEKIFDNIEARILSNPEVEFYIHENHKLDGVSKSAKLLNR